MSKTTVLFSIIACIAWGPLGLLEKAHAAPTAYSTKSVGRSISIIDTKIDQNFIRMMEGSKLHGYVPLVHSSQSGVTIAHGFDMGQLSWRELNNMDIDNRLKEKLRPYLGLKKYAALSYLKSHPLTISPSELRQLNLACANKILRPLVKYYNRASNKSFLDLPPAAQTVLFSYAYQYGPAFMLRSHHNELWQAFVIQDWHKVSSQLQKPTLYASRRKSEARLLDHLIL